jgi:hypothetical protein
MSFTVAGLGVVDGAFRKDGVQYPAGWLDAASQAERDRLGAQEASPPIIDPAETLDVLRAERQAALEVEAEERAAQLVADIPNNGWQGIAYGNKKLVIVANSGTNRIMVSSAS